MTLEPLAFRIQRALGLPAESVRVRRIGLAHRPLITLVDPSVEEKNDLERQREVRRRLQEAGIDERELGLIMVNTPAEDAALREDVLPEIEAGSAEAL